jgi:hypothetical protein
MNDLCESASAADIAACRSYSAICAGCIAWSDCLHSRWVIGPGGITPVGQRGLSTSLSRARRQVARAAGAPGEHRRERARAAVARRK